MILDYSSLIWADRCMEELIFLLGNRLGGLYSFSNLSLNIIFLIITSSSSFFVIGVHLRFLMGRLQ